MHCLLCKRFLFSIGAYVEVIIQERKIKVQLGKSRDICATQVNLEGARPEHVSECYFNIYSTRSFIFVYFNYSSIGMAKSALEAINGCNLFGEKGASWSVIYVDIDAHNRNRSIFETMLPRESSSKVQCCGCMFFVIVFCVKCYRKYASLACFLV
jgi:hypothetical protein